MKTDKLNEELLNFRLSGGDSVLTVNPNKVVEYVNENYISRDKVEGLKRKLKQYPHPWPVIPGSPVGPDFVKSDNLIINYFNKKINEVLK